MAEFNNLYQRAVYYDIVFKRDVSKEVQFIRDVYHHYTGNPLGSVIDLACGPGYHARAFARLGLRAVGLDLRGEMLAFAADEAAKEGTQVEWLEADMRYYQLEQPVDAAISMFDGIDALGETPDLLAHLRAVAANLTPNGIYLIDFSHPDESFYGYYGRFHYEGERDGITVEINWALNNPQFDYITGMGYVETEMRVSENGEQIIIRDSAVERMFTPQELTLLAELSGALHVVGWYGDAKLSQPFDRTPASRRMICIMQKR